uniref:Aamy domain-containing protein n=1 Tax=Ascaris lumbricoides TaxID=6252 RepID=A0A0M3IH18_ASCLU
MRTALIVGAIFVIVTANSSWYDNPQTLPNRQTMVHLFEWKWPDIAKECEDFLQHYGYGAVQVSPPNEHVIIIKNNDLPWWVRYQPISYKLSSRSGNREQFIDMVQRCNKVGIRCNHDIAGSDYQNNAINVRNCRLVSLIDLNQGSEYVRSKIIEYLNALIDIGVAGFRDLKWWGPGYGYGNLANNDVLAFIDNHDNQRDPHPYVPTYKNGDQYAMCVGFMFAWNYGYPRVISSYYFISSDQGPPNYGPSSNFTTESPQFAVDKSCLYSSGFVCEHRWQAIRGMARFRQECMNAAINNVTSDRNRLAFARVGKGYFALNNDYSTWTM